MPKEPKQRATITFRMWCPLSGTRIGKNPVIAAHRMTSTLCKNGAILGWCGIHQMRCFVTHPAIVRDILANSIVVEILQPGERSGKGVPSG